VFFFLTAESVIVLRLHDADRPRPFSVPLFPIIPLIFCATCAYMIHSGVMYAEKFGLVGGGLLVLGVPLYFIAGRRPEADAANLPPHAAALPSPSEDLA
jgi:amino acid transporter